MERELEEKDRRLNELLTREKEVCIWCVKWFIVERSSYLRSFDVAVFTRLEINTFHAWSTVFKNSAYLLPISVPNCSCTGRYRIRYEECWQRSS